MAATKMHLDEFDTNVALVERLVAGQFPRWAHLAVEKIRAAGTDNAMYRLGVDIAVRLPRIPSAAAQVDKEHEWLPRLAPLLPLAIPVLLAKGSPAEGYPWHWSVCHWLEGENATIERIADPLQAARDLAMFVSALGRIDATGGPAAGAHNFFRGVPLLRRDATTRGAIELLGGMGMVNAAAATAAWDAALAARAWDRPPVWIHGDLQSGNLLAVGGKLTAVIDFGGLGVGDPACDLMVAWNLFSSRARDVFRATLQPDDATWARGRGWALSVGLIALPYYRESNPALAEVARHAIDEVLNDHAWDG
jgi:aminoglycoside phosphotransferase (APT) family kinase protein